MSNLLVYMTMFAAWAFFMIYAAKGQGKYRRIASWLLAAACVVVMGMFVWNLVGVAIAGAMP